MRAFSSHSYAYIIVYAVLTFIRWNVENVRAKEDMRIKAGRCSSEGPSSSENIASLLGQAKGLLG
jgi:hypothetical protein